MTWKSGSRGLAAALAIVGIVLVGGGTTSTAAAALAQEETVSLLVTAVACPSAAGPAAGGCEPAVGVAVSVALPDGTVLGGCVTEAGTVQSQELGYCYVDGVPVGTVIATADAGTVPAGYALVEATDTAEVRQPGPDLQDYVPVVGFVVVPVAQPEPEQPTATEPAVTPDAPAAGDGDDAGAAEGEAASGGAGSVAVQLPNTGSGAASAPGASGRPVALVVTALTAVLALGAAGRRRVNPAGGS